MPIYSFGIHHPLKLDLSQDVVADFNSAQRKMSLASYRSFGEPTLSQAEYSALGLVECEVNDKLDDARNDLMSEEMYDRMIQGIGAVDLVENAPALRIPFSNQVNAAISLKGFHKALGVAAFAGLGIMLFGAFRNGDFNS